jgi:hypothetical protein
MRAPFIIVGQCCLAFCGWCIFAVALPVAAAPAASPDKLWEEFSGEKALEHVQRLVDLGPRPPASDALERSRVYIEKQ